MSQKVVYVRRGIAPMYDPDPDPDPFGIVGIAILAVIGITGGTLFTNPNIINNILMMFDPELKELEEDRLKAQEETVRMIGIVMALIAIIVVVYIFWRWNTQKKEAKARIKLNSKRLRTMGRMMAR